MKYKIILLSSFFLGMMGCTKLEESYRDSLSARSEAAIDPQAILQGAYNAMNNPFQDQSRFWAAQQHTTDETIGPTRGGDWDDNGVWRVLHSHKWTADHGFLRDTYRELLQAQYAATNVIEVNATPQQKAEARFIRALVMFAVLDGWNQVPFRQGESFNDVTKTPEVKVGLDALNYIIAELNTAIPDLPTGPIIKANKNAARALLMKCYLNKGAIANRATPTFDAADMNQVITLADAITSATTYSYQTNFFNNFDRLNSAHNTEIIYALENTPGTRGGNVRSRWFATLHYNQNPSGWNGFTTLSDFYDKFEANDQRRGMAYPGVTDVSGLRVGFLVGQQYNQSGVALNDRGGRPLAFTREVKLVETGTNLEVTGIRVVKYPPDYVSGDQSDNEYVVFRYSDVQLMKAEALMRTNRAAEALVIVNGLRTIRNATTLTALTLNSLLDERGRELYWEGWRRQDLIRFGRYLEAWQEKPADDGSHRLLFPIPNEQLAVNANLSQNPGY